MANRHLSAPAIADRARIKRDDVINLRNPKKALITGITGHDGSYLAEFLLEKGYTIRDLTHLIACLTDFEGDIRWDPSKPNGQPQRCLDVSHARDAFGFQAQTTLDQGLRRTIA
ncbi:MAG: GDP-mannose 4,6-dehydratase [Planctomycetota bacterium]|nr:GDP-mannose 4,6-dehydratase [Planctomycetota bacterium]